MDGRIAVWMATHRVGALNDPAVWVGTIDKLGAVWIVLALLIGAAKRLGVVRTLGLTALTAVTTLAADSLSFLVKDATHRTRPFVAHPSIPNAVLWNPVGTPFASACQAIGVLEADVAGHGHRPVRRPQAQAFDPVVRGNDRAQNPHRAALAGGAGGVDAAGDAGRAALVLGPGLELHLGGLDGAGVDDGHRVHVARAHGEERVVGSGGRGGAGVDLHEDVAEALADEHVVAGDNGDGLGAEDDAVIHCLPSDHRHDVGLERAAVDHRALGGGEMVDAGQEVGIGEVGGGGEETGDVDDGGRAEDDAGGVDEVDAAVAQDVPVDVGRVGAVDAVENAGRLAGQEEVGRVAAAEVEAAVVDDGVLARRGDAGVAAGLLNFGRAG